MNDMSAISQAFIKAPHFAVVGASVNREKFGNRVLRWYQSNSLDVTPVNPKEDDIESLKTVKSINELTNPTETSISIITPPKVTLQVLKDAKKISIQHVWIQPGGEDKEVYDFVKENSDSIHVVLGGPCILEDGPSLLKASLEAKR